MTADPETRRLAAEAAEAIRLADLPKLRELLLEAEARLAAAPPSRNRQRSTVDREGRP